LKSTAFFSHRYSSELAADGGTPQCAVLKDLALDQYVRACDDATVFRARDRGETLEVSQIDLVGATRVRIGQSGNHRLRAAHRRVDGIARP